jgi:hypothetical protein
VDVAPWTLALLVLAAFAAGMVDAVAGGGGLLTVPALFAAGLPPQLALGTNKGQSVFGSGAALLAYARRGLVRGRRAAVTFPPGLVGSALGALLVLRLSNEALKPVVLALLVAVAVFLAFRPAIAPAPRDGVRGAVERPAVALLVALAIGAYDGFFGPGTGTFLILAFVLLLGDTPLEASADAKVVNFASNLGACAVFATVGRIEWLVALPMAGGQFLGATLGARLTVRGGDAVVRRVVMVVVLATAAKLAFDLWRARYSS